MYSCGHNSVHWLYQWPCRCDPKCWLNYWGRVTHICVSKLSTIGSDNGLAPGWCQAIIWTNAETFFSRTFGTNFNEILSEVHTSSFKKMHLEMSSAKWRPFCLREDELIYSPPIGVVGLWVETMKPRLFCRHLHLYLREWKLLHTFQSQLLLCTSCTHDYVIKWKHFPRYWPFVMGIHQSPMDSPPKGQWRGALTFSLICAWTNGWANNRDAPSSSLWRHCNASVI